MEEEALLDRLIETLCAERGEHPPALSLTEKRKLFRALSNVRPPKPATEEFLRLQDEYLQRKNEERGVIDAESLAFRGGIALFQGDITRIRADAIVNACNSALLGCFQPLHHCIDNAIHSNAGVQVRLECAKLTGGKSEPNGRVRVTGGYNLPCRYIFHTVGPVVRGAPTLENRRDLENCYLSAMKKAEERALKTLVFCCISTGLYGYPKKDACDVAVATVRKKLKENPNGLKVVFDVFSDEDREIYERRLSGEN